jgi:hypothetical protein
MQGIPHLAGAAELMDWGFQRGSFDEASCSFIADQQVALRCKVQCLDWICRATSLDRRRSEYFAPAVVRTWSDWQVRLWIACMCVP